MVHCFKGSVDEHIRSGQVEISFLVGYPRLIFNVVVWILGLVLL